MVPAFLEVEFSVFFDGCFFLTVARLELMTFWSEIALPTARPLGRFEDYVTLATEFSVFFDGYFFLTVARLELMTFWSEVALPTARPLGRLI